MRCRQGIPAFPIRIRQWLTPRLRNRRINQFSSLPLPTPHHLSTRQPPRRQRLLSHHQTVLPQMRKPRLLRHIRRIIMLPVPPQPQHPTHHHLRTTPTPRRRHCRPKPFQTRRQIRPCHRPTLHPVTLRPRQQILTRKLPTVRCRIRKLIVRHTHNQRQLLHRRQIHPLMKRPGRRPPVPNRRCPNGVPQAPPQPPRKQHPRHHRHQRPQVTDHRQHPLLRPTPVNVPIPTPHRPRSCSQIRPKTIQQRLPKSNPPRLIPNQRPIHILPPPPLPPPRRPKRRRPRPQINPAHDPPPGSIQTPQLLLHLPRQLHATKRRHKLTSKLGGPVSVIDLNNWG
jgi:hypothetical protein